MHYCKQNKNKLKLQYLNDIYDLLFDMHFLINTIAILN